MTTAASQSQFRYRDRKRAAGECIYGGCHAPAIEGRDLCSPHAVWAAGRSSASKLVKMTDAELVAKREKHSRALRRIEDEIARRATMTRARRAKR